MAAVLALAGCTATGTAPVPGPGRGSLEVRSQSVPFTFADGAMAKRQADAECGPRGVRTSIYDRFVPATAAWVFAEGCA